MRWVNMEYKDFIHEIKNTPEMKEKQDILDAVNLSSKILFDINEEILTKRNNSSKNIKK